MSLKEKLINEYEKKEIWGVEGKIKKSKKANKGDTIVLKRRNSNRVLKTVGEIGKS